MPNPDPHDAQAEVLLLDEAKFLIDRVISGADGDVSRVSLYSDVAPAIAAALRKRDATIERLRSMSTAEMMCENPGVRDA